MSEEENKVEIKTMVNSISVYTECAGHFGNPVFNCIKVNLQDDAAGGFLEIEDNTDRGNGAKVSFDWDEWDAVVKVVEKYRKEWQYE